MKATIQIRQTDGRGNVKLWDGLILRLNIFGSVIVKIKNWENGKFQTVFKAKYKNFTGYKVVENRVIICCKDKSEYISIKGAVVFEMGNNNRWYLTDGAINPFEKTAKEMRAYYPNFVPAFA